MTPTPKAPPTPGPWTRVPQTKGGDLIAHSYETGDQMNPKGLRLIAFMMVRGDSLGADDANARLIAAAPAMYEALAALEHAGRFVPVMGNDSGHVDVVRFKAALDRATSALAAAASGQVE